MRNAKRKYAPRCEPAMKIRKQTQMTLGSLLCPMLRVYITVSKKLNPWVEWLGYPNQAQFLYTFLMKKSYTIGCVNLMNLIWRCRVFHHACDDTIQLGSHIQANTCVTLFPSHWDLSSPLVNCQKLNISHCCCIWPVPMANGWFRSIVRHVEF